MAERYEFIRKVAQGGFGRVYVARDTRLGREVAIKRLLDSGGHTEAQDQAEATFQREATTLAAMQHPNIVQIFDFDRDEDGTFVVMEMLEGETPKERLDRGPLTWETFVTVARQALDAINAAHLKGILHRDLKPENLFLHRTASGTRVLKILDFGLAKLSQVPSKQTMDQAGNVMGSIYYMAPEQFLRQPLDGRTDLYALGCVFYQSLTQRFPFEGANMQGTMEAHMEHKVKPLIERRPDINPAVAAWLMRLISFKMGERPPDAATALREFEAALANASSAPAPVMTVAAPTVTRPAPSSSQLTPTRITSTIGESGRMKTPMQTRAVSALEVARAEERAKMEAAAQRTRKIIMIAAPVLGLLILTFVLTRGQSPSRPPAAAPASASSSQAQSPAPSQPKIEDLLPPTALLTLPFEDSLAWRFRAGVEMWHKGGDGKQQATAILAKNGRMHEWKNLASAQRDSWLRPYENKADRAPSTLKADVNGHGTSSAYLFFSSNTGMESRLPSTESRLAPGGPESNPPGVTVAVVFRANSSSKESTMRPLILRPAKGGTDSFSLHFSHRVGQYWVMVQHNGQVSQTLVRPEQFTKSGSGGNWIALIAAWDAVGGVLRLKVRSPDGRTASAPDAPLPSTGMPMLDRLNVGSANLDKQSKLKQGEKMDGDIVEIAVYRRVLDEASRDKVLNGLWDRYFKKR